MEKKIIKSKEKEYVAEYNKKYYQKNREKQLQMMKVRVPCACCNTTVTKDKLKRHMLTKKHKNNELKAVERPQQ